MSSLSSRIALISDVDDDLGVDSLTLIVIAGHCADVNVVGLYFGSKLRAHLNRRLETTFGAVVSAFICRSIYGKSNRQPSDGREAAFVHLSLRTMGLLPVTSVLVSLHLRDNLLSYAMKTRRGGSKSAGRRE